MIRPMICPKCGVLKLAEVPCRQCGNDDEETTRYTTIKLRVAWNPAEQDHPMNWDYETLLEVETDFIDFE